MTFKATKYHNNNTFAELHSAVASEALYCFNLPFDTWGWMSGGWMSYLPFDRYCGTKRSLYSTLLSN